MRVIQCAAQNFGSYATLEFNFLNQGLALIHGATGSGKSTLLDIVPWILYGVTAKDGNADDVRSWTRPDEPTTGDALVKCNDGSHIIIKRTRGQGKNDLYWMEHGSSISDPIRGKDITETQKLLEARLGVPKDMFLTSTYYNEFSPIRHFFSTSASSRRELLERIVDLEFPKRILEKVAEHKKIYKKKIVPYAQRLDREVGRLESLKSSKRSLDDANKNFDKNREIVLSQTRANHEKWEAKKTKDINDFESKINDTLLVIQSDTSECPACGAANEKVRIAISNRDYFRRLLKVTKESVNPHSLEMQDNNEFEPIIMEHEKQIQESIIKIKEYTIQHDEAASMYNTLDQLGKLTSDLRAALLVRSVKYLEDMTNVFLEKYFDSQIRIKLTIAESDRVEIDMWKSGYSCNYKQLSKGQLSILRLCFTVAVMKAASNKIGTHFNALLFDEPADGSDSDLKIKSFRLFESLALEHETVLVIDHNESLKDLFSKSYCVTMNEDESTINEKS